jgi:predicted DNA binding CopG/RHH family protein
LRKREHAFILRLNNDEMYHLKRQVEKSGLSREVYMRKLIMCREIRERPQRDCVELLREVRSQSKLLNAVAQNALRQGFVNERQVERLLDGYQDLLVAAKRLV